MHLSRYICTCPGAYQFWGIAGEADESAFGTTSRPAEMGTGAWSVDAGYAQRKRISPSIQAGLVVGIPPGEASYGCFIAKICGTQNFLATNALEC